MKEEASLTQKFQNIFFNKYISYICICYNQLQANKLDKLDEWTSFKKDTNYQGYQDTTTQKVKNLNRTIARKKTELVILKLPTKKKVQAQTASLMNSTIHLKS